ncbi:MAG TPA: hypothetical protein VFT16_03235 [Candidatus Saccharimonadales bacterium]|nr:hypothetical protein [Candidatus Saccharimonadales bacterium]
MRNRILLIAGVVVFVLTAIFWGPNIPKGSTGPAVASPPSPSVSEPTRPSQALQERADPDELLDEIDLKEVTDTPFKKTRLSAAGKDKSYYERSTVFVSQDTGYKPNSDNKPVSLILGSWVDDTAGTYFKTLVNEAKASNKYYGGLYVPEGDAGPDAFLSHDGVLTARKGQVIIRLVAHDEGLAALNDTTLTTLAVRALKSINTAN